MRSLALIILLAARTLSAFVVTVTAVSPTQAVFTYSAPSSSACTVEVSESNTYSPVVPDVDNSLFTGSNSDARSTALTNGTARLFLAGTRQLQTDNNMNVTSRALQQGTLHYVRVTCGILGTGTTTFTTQTLPFGTTYADLFPIDSSGNYLFPSVDETTRNAGAASGGGIIDPQTGVKLTLWNLAADADVTSNGSPVPVSGGFGDWCNDLTDGQGNYHCAFPSQQGIDPGWYAINPTTGAAIFIGVGTYFVSNIDPAGSSVRGIPQAQPAQVMWDASDGNVAYADATINATGRTTIVKFSYSGADAPQTSPVSIAGTVTDLLGGTGGVTGQDLGVLLNAYTVAQSYPAVFDNTTQTCNAVNFQANLFMIHCNITGTAAQDTPMWLAVYDPGNFLPLGFGGNGHYISATNMVANPVTRWCGMHTNEYVGNNAIMSTAVGNMHFGVNGGGAVGPWGNTLQTTMTSGTTNINVTSTYSFGTPPSGYVTGEPVSAFVPHFLQTNEVGDNLFIDNEDMVIVTKVSPTNYIVSRGQGGTTAANHSIGTEIDSYCKVEQDSALNSGGYTFWDFNASPDATNATDYKITFGDHPVYRQSFRIDDGYPYRTGNITNTSIWGNAPTLSVTSTPVFSSVLMPGSGNAYQKHTSAPSTPATQTFLDNTYWVGTNIYCAQTSSCTSNSPGGSLYKYFYNTGAGFGGGILFTGANGSAPKILPTVAKTYQHSFIDISSATTGNVIGTGAGDNWKYCIAYKANECRTGSSAGDVFFNHPTLNATFPWCSGGENGTTIVDICMGAYASNGMVGIQFGIANDSTGASTYRPLTRLFQSFESITYMSDNLKCTTNGKFCFFLQEYVTSPHVKTNIWAIHVPDIPVSDGVNRGLFVPATVSLAAPGGTSTAQVRFWYTEQGGDSTHNYCTSRRENCISVNTTTPTALNPFAYETSDAPTPVSCTTTCSIVLPVIPLHTAYFQADFLNGGGGVISSKLGVATEGTVTFLGANSGGGNGGVTLR